MGSNHGCTPQIERRRDPAAQTLAVIKGYIDAGKGIGSRTILDITQSRRKLHTSPAIDTEDKKKSDSIGLKAIREAVATLKASGEHDTIIKDEASKVAERREREAREAAERA